MNTVLNKLTAVWLMVSLTTLLACGGKKEAPAANASAPAPQQAATANFGETELDELLAPIALYPDPLLAQIMPASTFVDQIDAAARLLGGKADNDLIDQQDWDVSVKAVAHYPMVLERMNQNQDWTIALGQAYVNQPTDVMKSIQHLRAQAWDAGTLITTPEQQVVTEGDSITIVPAQPQVIYVPQYEPEVVYVSEDSGVSTGAAVATAAISFAAGMAIGAWLNRDYDWDDGIYYHGWEGEGWIGVNRSYVDVNRNVYINNSYRNINVNRAVVNRDISNYRGDLDRRATVRRDRDIDKNRRNDIDPRTGRLKDRPTDRLGEPRGREGQARDRQQRTVDRTPATSGDRNRGKESRERMDTSARKASAGAGTRDRSGGSAGKSARSGGGAGKGARSAVAPLPQEWQREPEGQAVVEIEATKLLFWTVHGKFLRLNKWWRLNVRPERLELPTLGSEDQIIGRELSLTTSYLLRLITSRSQRSVQ